jgi:ribosomal-protein-alanine N-acetyltransferase
VLRRITNNDLEDMFVLRSNKEAMTYIGRPIPVVMDETARLIQKMEENIDSNTGIVWGVALKGESRVIGSIGYHRIEPENYRAEIGYMLLPEFWSKGIMSEALKEIIHYGFEMMNLHSIQANINPENANSRKILLKFDFVKEAYFKESFYFDGKFFDSEIYSLLKHIGIK